MLSDTEINAICATAGGDHRKRVVMLILKWDAGEDRRRTAMRSVLSLDFVYGITTARSPVEQIHHDLMAMLRSPRLIGIVGRPIELAMRAFIDAIPDADYDQFSADVRAVICG